MTTDGQRLIEQGMANASENVIDFSEWLECVSRILKFRTGKPASEFPYPITLRHFYLRKLSPTEAAQGVIYAALKGLAEPPQQNSGNQPSAKHYLR